MIKDLILDFDSTIVDSRKAYIEAYIHYYQFQDGFTMPDPNSMKLWCMADQCTLADTPEKVNEIFESNAFWSKLEFMPDAYESIEELSEHFNLSICSIGTFGNIAKKTTWIEKKLSLVKNGIMITNNGIKMDKSIVDMSGAIFVDDVESNLVSSNAKLKICFGKKFSWNENWNWLWKEDWRTLKNYLFNLVY